MAGSLFFAPNAFPAGSKAYFYENNTTSMTTVYKDVDLDYSHAQPVLMNGASFPPIYHGGDAPIRVIVTDENDVRLDGFPRDDVWAFPDGSGHAREIPFSPTEELPYTNVQAALEGTTALAQDQTGVLQRSLTPWRTGGTGNAYEISPSPEITAYGTWQSFTIVLDRSNTGTPTLNVNGKGAQPWRKMNNGGNIVSIGSGELREGVVYQVTFDGTQFYNATSAGEFLAKNQNLGDINSISQARDNLNLGTLAIMDTGTDSSEVRTNSQNDNRFLRAADNLAAITNPETARTSLGLGSSATRNMGTGGSNIRDNDQNDARYHIPGEDSLPIDDLPVGPAAEEWVGDQYSDLAYDDKGSTAFLALRSVEKVVAGTVYSGSDLRTCKLVADGDGGAVSLVYGDSLPGNWMATSGGDAGSDYGVITLNATSFKRVS